MQRLNLREVEYTCIASVSLFFVSGKKSTVSFNEGFEHENLAEQPQGRKY